MLEELSLAEEIVEALHRVGKLVISIHFNSTRTFACSIAPLFLLISPSWALRASVAALLWAAASALRLAAGVRA